MKWNKIEDKLPKTQGEDYLVVVKNKNKEGGIYIYDVAMYEDGLWYKSNTWEKVTHWQPLPKEPK